MSMKKGKIWYFLEEDLHTIEHEDAALPRHSNLIAVKQLELSCTFVVVILDADASMPFLNLS